MLHDARAGILARVSARRLALLGRDYPALGPLGVARLPGVGALALSRGAERKAYYHVDPNEDGALLVADAAGVLLAVADGYNGVAASEVALRLTGRAARELLAPDLEGFTAAVIALVGRIARELDPGPQDTDPYSAARTPLPKSLMESLHLLEQSALFRAEVGATFVDYFIKLKRNEAGRFLKWLEENGVQDRPDEPTAWEQNEYFDFF